MEPEIALQETVTEATEEDVTETPVSEQLTALLKSHQFKEADVLINENDLDINKLFESNRGPKWLVGSTLLTSVMNTCDQEIISFLINRGANPNIAMVTYGYEEWSPNSIPDDIDIKAMKEKGHDGFTIKESPLEKSLSCEDAAIFYQLIEAGGDDQRAIIQGAISWEDTVLLKKAISEGAVIDFVPGTDRMDILKMLVPFTDGKQYGEIGYGEGGDMFESDLMYASDAGNVALVWFMLETGADPNHCLPKNYVDGEFIEPDSAGYYPASTPLSIAQSNYDSNLEIHSKRDDDTVYLERANDNKKIIEMLRAHGASQVSKCLGP